MRPPLLPTGPPTEGFRDRHRRDMRTLRCRARTVGISGRVFADRNADRPVESAEIDIPARHPRDANVDPAAICLPDAYVDGEPA